MSPVLTNETAGPDMLGPDGNRQTSEGAPPPPPTDRPPKRRPGRPKKQLPKPAITDAQLTMALTELLCAPGVAFDMMGQAWPAAHVIRTGPELAQQLVAFGKVNPKFREYLEKAVTGNAPIALMMGVYMLGMAAATYIVPLLAYYGIIPRAMGEKFTGPIPVMVAPVPPPFMNGAGAPPMDTGGTVVSTDD